MHWSWTLLFSLLLVPAAARADAPEVPAPSASAQPEQPNDPCGGPTRLLASLDRPTVGFSTCAAPPGSALLEEGYQINTQAGPAASVNATYPQGFQRFGIAPGVELDVIGPTFNRLRSASGVATGFSDIGLGFKYEFAPKTKVQFAIDGLVTAATGASAFTAGGPTEQLNVDIAYPLGRNVGLGTTLGFASTSGAPANTAAATTPGTPPTPGTGASANNAAAAYSRYATFIPSFVITDLLDRSTQFYAEYVNPTKIAPDLGGRAYTDFGVQRLFGPAVEIDAEYGIDFTPVQGSRFNYVGVGFGLYVK